jgi:hypothetical protein
MVNLLGYEHSTSDYAEKRQRLAEIPNATVHWYHKTPAAPGASWAMLPSVCQLPLRRSRQRPLSTPSNPSGIRSHEPSAHPFSSPPSPEAAMQR